VSFDFCGRILTSFGLAVLSHTLVALRSIHADVDKLLIPLKHRVPETMSAQLTKSFGNSQDFITTQRIVSLYARSCLF
jgi:hypothetical protein